MVSLAVGSHFPAIGGRRSEVLHRQSIGFGSVHPDSRAYFSRDSRNSLLSLVKVMNS